MQKSNPSSGEAAFSSSESQLAHGCESRLPGKGPERAKRWCPNRAASFAAAALFSAASCVGLVFVGCTDSSADGGLGGGGQGGSQPQASGGQNYASGGTSPAPSASGDELGTGGAGTGGASPDEVSEAWPEVQVHSAAQLTDVSAPDYGDNEHGVISGGRFASWLNNWKEKRPKAIQGKLVVLQIVPAGVTSFEVTNANEEAGVYSYLVGAGVFNQTRDNGLSDFESDIPDGASFDAFLKKYDIDPRKDLVVLSFEQLSSTTNSITHSVGRAWLFLRYWGFAAEHVAILNGSLNYNRKYHQIPSSTVAAHLYSDPKNTGKVTARHLGADNTTLWLTVEEILNYLDQGTGAPTTGTVRILDARGGAEALGVENATSTGRTGCSQATKCSTPLEGRIKGARSVPWTDLLEDKSSGFRFRSPAELKNLLTSAGELDSSIKEAWVYCRTNQRATVNGIVLAAILGIPTRFYETSFIEWGHLSYGPDGEPNKRILPQDSAFRTDLDKYTEHAVLDAADSSAYTPGGALGTLTKPVTWLPGPYYNPEKYVEAKTSSYSSKSGWPLISTSAKNSQAAISADRAWIRGEVVSP